jgi:hypothetical protein
VIRGREPGVVEGPGGLIGPLLAARPAPPAPPASGFPQVAR